MIELSIKYDEQLKFDEAMVACIGYFDGFHLGHQTLFNKTLVLAKEKSVLSAIISFEPDPWTILQKLPLVKHLSTIHDRQMMAKKMGFDVWIVIEFNMEMASMSHELFIQRLLDLSIHDLVCGFDFKFGARGKGDVAYLKQIESDTFHVHVCEEYRLFQEKVSTTRIKKALSEGRIELANQLLGRPFELRGEVIKGRQIGRKIGYPTANLSLNKEYFTPKHGVYVGYVEMDQLHYQAMMSVGKNPTVKDDDLVSIEAHILDFDRDIYGLEVRFQFLHYLRPEEKYSDLQELIDQIKIDEKHTRMFFKYKD
jgi:riboflavin kinase / FMN adenylyltransferase